MLFLAVDEQHEPDPARNQRQEKPGGVEVHQVDNSAVHMTRRQLLEMAALMAAAPRGLFAASQAGDKTGLDVIVQRASDTIRAYSAEGFHRTATAVDRASADALLDRARATGATASLEPFTLSRVDPIASYLQIGTGRIQGLPMFDSALFTGVAGVSGTIGPVGSDHPIGWTRIAPNAEAPLRKMRDGSRHRAIEIGRAHV